MSSSFVIATVTGPMLLGHLFNYALMGVLGLQVYIYALSFPKDRLWIKALVFSILFLDIFQTGVATHYAWYVLASGWGIPDVLRFTPWSLACIPPLAGSVALLVQFFFIWRIWVLGEKKRRYTPVLAVILLAAITACVAAYYAGVLSGMIHDVAKASEIDTPVTVWLTGSIICDVVITFTLVFQLSSKRNRGFGSLNQTIHRSIRMALETGAITSAVVIIELVLYLRADLTSWYFMLGMVIGKLYSNSFLANLNARSQTFKGNVSDSEQSGVQLWKATQQLDITVDTSTITSSSPDQIVRKNNIELCDIDTKISNRGDTKLAYSRAPEEYS